MNRRAGDYRSTVATLKIVKLLQMKKAGRGFRPAFFICIPYTRSDAKNSSRRCRTHSSSPWRARLIRKEPDAPRCSLSAAGRDHAASSARRRTKRGRLACGRRCPSARR